MWMNEGEIDYAVEVIGERTPEYSRYAKYLRDWKDVVNDNSDGWPYWKAGGKAAERLMDCVLRVQRIALHGGAELPTEKEFRASLTPIKSLATKHGLTAPTLEDTPSTSPSP